jgi:hypothetical protein
MKKCWQIFFAVFVLVLAMMACGSPAPEYVLRGWTVTPSIVASTQTPIVVIHTSTPLPTLTPVYVEITNTPEQVLAKCVSASVAVHLRPSPNTSGYPIEALANGIEVKDLGGRSGKWWFVSVGDKQGWVDSGYLGRCS